MGLILYKLALKTFSIKAKHDKGLFEDCLLKHVYLVGLLKAFGHYEAPLASIMLIIKELKLPRPVLTKGLHIETMLVASLYQAIALLQIPFNRKVLS